MRRISRAQILIAGTATLTAVVAAPSHGASAPAGPLGYLFDVSAVSSTDVWAVGTTVDLTTSIWHWDGNRWAAVQSPDPGEEESELFSVEAISSTDVWAVGRWGDDATRANTLVEHWNGVMWSVVPSPNSPDQGTQDALVSISAAGPDDIWAVGHAGTSRSYRLIEHWDGQRWTVVSPRATDGTLEGVSAWAADDARAVGTYPDRIEHWDGSSWTAEAAAGGLKDVGGTSPTDLWAVGGLVDAPVTEHWDGQGWSVVPAGHGVGYNFSLNGVTAISPTDVWAVGEKHGNRPHNYWIPLIKHWDGSSWSKSGSRNRPIGVRLESVDGVASDDVWAVGSAGGQAEIEHWNGHRWSRYAF